MLTADMEPERAHMQDAGWVMGNTALIKQMQEASAAIKRDVVFAPSLYVM